MLLHVRNLSQILIGIHARRETILGIRGGVWHYNEKRLSRSGLEAGKYTEFRRAMRAQITFFLLCSEMRRFLQAQHQEFSHRLANSLDGLLISCSLSLCDVIIDPPSPSSVWRHLTESRSLHLFSEISRVYDPSYRREHIVFMVEVRLEASAQKPSHVCAIILRSRWLCPCGSLRGASGDALRAVILALLYAEKNDRKVSSDCMMAPSALKGTMCSQLLFRLEGQARPGLNCSAVQTAPQVLPPRWGWQSSRNDAQPVDEG